MIYRFGDIELDTTLFELRRRGVPVSVEPQVFDVLTYLIVHRERVVTKEELLDNVWGDRFVSESALTTRIKTARRAVGDDGQSQHGRAHDPRARLPVRRARRRARRCGRPVEVAAQTRRPRRRPAAAPGADRRGPAAAPVVNVFSVALSEVPTSTSWPLLGRSDEIETIAAAFRDPACGRHPDQRRRRASARPGSRTSACGSPPRPACPSLASPAIPRPSGCPSPRSPTFCRSEVTRPSGPEGELDRALLFHRARAALEQVEQGRRWVVMVDDIDQLDELSRALLVSLVHAQTAFVVCTIRTTGSNDDEVRTLVNDSHLRRIEPTPLVA